MNTKLKTLLTTLAGQARMNLEMCGRLLPVAFLQSTIGGKSEVIGCPFTNPEEKERTIETLRRRAKEIKANLFIFIGEAWMADVSDGWDGRPAAEQANRREIVQIYVESMDDGYWIGQAPITRDKGRPTFGEVIWEPMTEERKENERFQNIL